jgi:hypothetical protein
VGDPRNEVWRPARIHVVVDRDFPGPIPHTGDRGAIPVEPIIASDACLSHVSCDARAAPSWSRIISTLDIIMTSGPHDNFWAILTAILVGLAGWGIVKVPRRWYITATRPTMYLFWGVLLFWSFGAANQGIALRLRDLTGFLFLFELVLGPLVATQLAVIGVMGRKITERKTFVVNQLLTWPFAILAFGFWGMIFYAGRHA